MILWYAFVSLFTSLMIHFIVILVTIKTYVHFMYIKFSIKMCVVE